MTEVASASVSAVPLPPGLPMTSTSTTATATATDITAGTSTMLTPTPELEETVGTTNVPETTKTTTRDSSNELDGPQEREHATAVEQAASTEPTVDRVPVETTGEPSGDKVGPRGAEGPAEPEEKVEIEGTASSEAVESSRVAISQEQQQHWQPDTVDNVDTTTTATTTTAAGTAAGAATTDSDASAEAKKAYELAHVHQNDEVAFATPTDEQIKAASSLAEDVVPESEKTDKAEEPEKPEIPSVDGVTEAEPETKEEHPASTILPLSSESGMESLSSIPTETDTQLQLGEDPSSVPEEPKEEEIQLPVTSVVEEVEAEHKDEVQTKHEEPDADNETKKEPEVFMATPPDKGEETESAEVRAKAASEAEAGAVDAIAADAKEAPETVEHEHEAAAEEGPVDRATFAEPAATTEHEDKTKTEGSASAETPKPGVLDNEKGPLEDAPSGETPALAPEETTEVSAATHTGSVDGPSEKVDKAVSDSPAADATAEVATDDKAEVPSKEVAKPEDESSVEHPIEAAESIEPANVALETSITETDVADVQETPSDGIAANDGGKEVEELNETAEVALAAPTEAKTIGEPTIQDSSSEFDGPQECVTTVEQAASTEPTVDHVLVETTDGPSGDKVGPRGAEGPAEPEGELETEGAASSEVVESSPFSISQEEQQHQRQQWQQQQPDTVDNADITTTTATVAAAGAATADSDASAEAKKAYELAHVHQNDEVAFATPTDEQIKAASSLAEDVGPESEKTDKAEEPEKPEIPSVDGVTEAEPETKEEHPASSVLPLPSESGMESLSSVPTETDTQLGEDPTSVPEESKEGEIQHPVTSVAEEVEAEHKDEVQAKHEEPDDGTETRKEPEVSMATPPDKGEETESAEVQEEAAPEAEAGAVDAIAADAKETPETVERELEAAAEEGPVDGATSAEGAGTTEHEDKTQAEGSVSGETPKPDVLDNEKSPLEDVPSGDAPTPAPPEETTEVSAAAHTGSVDASSEQAEEAVSDSPAADATAEVATDDKAEVLSEEVIKPEDEPSVEHPVEAAEPTEPAIAAALEASVSEIATADVQETPSGETAANDGGKEVEELKEPAEVSVAAPTEVEAVVEPVVVISTEEVMPSQESTPEQVQEQPAITKDGEVVAQAVDETLDIQHVEADATPAEPTEVTVTEVESKPEGAVADEVASEVVPEALEKALHEPAVNETEGVSESIEKSVDAEPATLLAAGTETHASVTEESTAIEGAGTDIEATVDTSAVEDKVEETVSATKDEAVLQNAEDFTTSEEAKPVKHATEVAQGPILQSEGQEAEAAGSIEADESATAVGYEETDDVTVPDVQVETPTPMSETLEVSSDEDEDDAGIPLEHRLAMAAGVPAEVLTKILWTTSTTPPEISTSAHDHNGSFTPIQTKGEENVSGENGVKDAASGLETEDLETPSQSMFLERPQQDTDATAAESALNTDVTETPERPKSPWTPSYSVTTQGSAPAHPDEPLEEIISEKVVDAQPEEAKIEKEQPTETEPVQSEATLPPPETVEERVSEEDPSAPAVVVQDTEPFVREEAALVDAMVSQETRPVPVQEDVAQELTSVTEEHEVQPPVEIVAEDTTEAVDVVAKTKPSTDVNVTDVLERPRSPWTPSYSVTKMGPGVPEPEDLHLDAGASAKFKVDAVPAEVLQAGIEEQTVPSEHEVVELTEAPKPAPAIERPKSLFPPAYVVTQMGPGTAEEASAAKGFEDSAPSPIWASVAASVADSNEPEAPSSPRSELGAVTPGFDSRSEVSEASHIPIPPDSPRTDPDVATLSDAEVKTPLVVGAEDQGMPVSPLQTPLLSADKVVEAAVAPEALTESAVSYINVDVENSTTTGSWVKDADNERESNVDSGLPLSNDVHSVEASKEPAVCENDISVSVSERLTVEEAGAETQATERAPIVPELKIPKLDIRAPTPTVQPVPVTNTLSADSAYTQISEGFSPSQETGTNVTTPDVESSDQPWSTDSTVRVLNRTGSKGKSLGIAHTLAMRTFPSAFADSERPSTSEQTQQTEADILEEDNQLSPLSARRRLESTVSSLAFPGGWVSSPSHKGRASLETAAGEFSKPVGGSATPVPVTEPDSEQKESKWRCVIM